MINSTMIRLEKPLEQTEGAIKRVIGFVQPRDFISFFGTVTLDANPRSAKANRVTKAIISSLKGNPKLFQFKSKGILLGARKYEALDGGSSYKLYFEDPRSEGLLDGGHNMLALGNYMLGKVIPTMKAKKLEYWWEILEAWNANKGKIAEYEGEFGFNVPVEILIPANAGDKQVVQEFGKALAEICAARNNNAQLTTEAIDNRWGLYDEVEKHLSKNVWDRVEWRTNDWKDKDVSPIKARSIIPLAWLPLGVLDEHGHLPPKNARKSRSRRKWIDLENSARTLYSGKGALSNKFGELMRHEEVSRLTSNNRYEAKNVSILSAFEVFGKIPELHDLIYSGIITSFIDAGGEETKLEGVEKRETKTPYTNSVCHYEVPLGYVMPILVGLKVLMDVEDGEVFWKHDPEDFLSKNMGEIGKRLRETFDNQSTFDPQKIGKNRGSYSYMIREMGKML